MAFAFTDGMTQLGYLINDTLSQSGIDQKTQAMTFAWNDRYVCTSVMDNSLTYVRGTFTYAKPSTVTTVSDILVERDSNQYPEPIDSSLWDTVGGNIIFSNAANLTFSGQNYSLWIRGKYKLQVTDTIPTNDTALQNYVVNLAGLRIINQLKYTKALSFLRNDTSLAELMALGRDLAADVAAYRAQLPTSYVAQ